MLANFFIEQRKSRARMDDRLTLRARAAASVASFFYTQWRASNKQLGIKDHGHGAAIKELCGQGDGGRLL